MIEPYVAAPSRSAALPHPPKTPGLPLVGSLPAFLRRPFTFLLRARARYGDIYTLDAGFLQIVALNHPRQVEYVLQEHSRNYLRSGVLYDSLRAFIGNGLAASDGEYWLRQRRMMQPHFHRKRLAMLTDVMVSTIADELPRSLSTAQSGTATELVDAFSRITMKVLVRTIFGTALRDHEVDTLATEIGYAVNHLFLDAMASSLPAWLPIPGVRRYRQARAVVDAALYDVIARTRDGEGSAGSLMQIMLDLVDAETGAQMTDQQLRDEAVTLVLAGYETTSLTLAWICQLLTQHTDKLAKLQAEVDTLEGRVPTFADLPALPYTSMVIQEAMRLYPAAWTFTRQAVADDVIDGHAIRAGTTIAVLPYTIHRHPELWDDPERFLPERFLPERVAERHKYAWIAFGLGQHKCLGKDFALMEAQLILAMLLQHYRMEAIPGRVAEPELSGTLRPKGGVWVTLAPRS